MQGDIEETVGIAGQRVPRRLWEAEIVLRCAAWVAGIHGATLLGLGIPTEGLQIQVLFLPDRIERILAGAALLGVSALVLGRRGRWAVFSIAALHLLYAVYAGAVLLRDVGYWSQYVPQGAKVPVLVLVERGARRIVHDPACLPYLPVLLLAILLPLFIALAVIGRHAKEAFSSAFRGNPLAPLASCLRAGASVRAWAALGVVALSLAFIVQLLFLWFA